MKNSIKFLLLTVISFIAVNIDVVQLDASKRKRSGGDDSQSPSKKQETETTEQEVKAQEEKACAICYNDLQDSDSPELLECKHAFHLECIHTLVTTRYDEKETKDPDVNPYTGSFPLPVPTFSSKCPVCRADFNTNKIVERFLAKKFPDPEERIYANIENPHFDMMNSYLQLPKGRDEKTSSRQRVLNTLTQRAEKFVKETDEKDLRALFQNLPEGWYKMEIRRQFQVIKNRLIDTVPVDKIMEKVNAADGNVNAIFMNLALPLKGIIDLLLVRNEIRPILSLDLSYNQLIGPIQATLGDLVNLEFLDLSNNQLTGPIPATLSNLVNLTRLNLSYNQLTGPIPATLGNLVNLIELNLAQNQLTGGIPAVLGDLAHLTRLNLSYNQLTGPIPATLDNLGHLIELSLAQNQLTGPIPAAIDNLVNLTELALNHNQLTGPIPAAAFSNLVKLTVLNLSVNKLTGPIPATLGNLVNLIELNLAQNQLTGGIPAVLGDLAHLTRLNLSYNQLTGPIPATLGNLGHLTHLALNNNLLTGPAPDYFGKSHLHYLNLSGNQLTGRVPYFGNLHFIDLYLNKNQLDQG